jgi:hypothetical protein
LETARAGSPDARSRDDAKTKGWKRFKVEDSLPGNWAD